MAVLGLGALSLGGLTAAASATPTVTARAAIVPIPKNPRNANGPTWPGTGDILGAGAALEIESKIVGTEYFGAPSPVKQIKIVLPKGTKVSEKGFARCSETILHAKGPAGCPLKSFASPIGEAHGVVSIAGERVPERATVQGFFNQTGGLIFSIIGSTPVSFEEFATATYQNTPNGVVGTAQLPLISTLPEAPYASAEQFKIKIGAAFKQGKKLVSFGTVPKTCKGRLTGKYEITFLSGEIASGEVSVPCPKHKK
jgi:hypothetical protein